MPNISFRLALFAKKYRQPITALIVEIKSPLRLFGVRQAFQI